MTLDGEDGGNDDLGLTSREQCLCEYSQKCSEGDLSESCPSTPFQGHGEEEEQADDMHEEQATGNFLEEVTIVKDVIEGNNEANENAGSRHSSLLLRSKERNRQTCRRKK